MQTMKAKGEQTLREFAKPSFHAQTTVMEKELRNPHDPDFKFLSSCF